MRCIVQYSENSFKLTSENRSVWEGSRKCLDSEFHVNRRVAWPGFSERGCRSSKGPPHFNGGRMGPESKMLYNVATNG